MIQLTQLSAWKTLEQKAHTFLFQKNEIKQPLLSSSNISLDYNAQRLDKDTHTQLVQLAQECHLPQKISDLFKGHFVNTTERKPALHWALRAAPDAELWLKDDNIIEKVQKTLHNMHEISNQIRAQQWLGYSGKPITDIVNLGIGGSHLGPFFCLHALADLKLPSLHYHFISDFDPLAFTRATASLNPETTLFIVSSKSFTTVETLYNLKQAIAWINNPQALDQHFIAVTASPEKAIAFGINHILPIWDWIGGRYSLCSAINLITCIAIGFTAFAELLAGAESMDEHFRNTPLAHNLPVNLALLGIWTNNFLKIHQLLLLTYAQPLDHFTAYIQQLDMESNGKAIDHQGKAVNYATGPIVWGGSGNQAQHSYYQLLCQGTHYIAADLISVNSYQQSPIHQLCMAQKEVLSTGTHTDQNKNDYVREHAALNHIHLKDTSPFTIGALISLYEHKIYTQGVIWQINPFDQPGVESSKRLMKQGFFDV